MWLQDYNRFLLACLAGELWQFYAWFDEGEHPAQQESAFRVVDARALQLQSTCRHLSQCISRKQGPSKERGYLNRSLIRIANLFHSADPHFSFFLSFEYLGLKLFITSRCWDYCVDTAM